MGAPSFERGFLLKCFVRCVLFAAYLSTHEDSFSVDDRAIQYNYFIINTY